MTDTETGELGIGDDALLERIRSACVGSFGVLQSSFLCQSLVSLNLKPMLKIDVSSTLREATKSLQLNNTGCALVVNPSGRLDGIFTERDCLTKIIGTEVNLDTTLVSAVMTREPVCESAECTVAYALSLMSNGGFRHIPIVDDEHCPVGVVSVRDIVDHIVDSMLNDLLNYK